MAYEYTEFKADVYKLTGIDLNLYKERQMKRRIESLIARKRFPGYKEFFKGMEQDKDLLHTFVSFLTINVSEFYRNPGQWEYLISSVIPMLVNEFGNKLKIWSAACSTGDEPYTLAMTFAKYLPLENIEILATDIDDEVLEFAKEGVYQERSIKGLPDEFKLKYTKKRSDGTYAINQEIKDRITFKKHNLLADPYPKDMNLIVCRNVVIYFTDEAKDEIYKKFHQSLKNNGMLFIGSTEQIMHSKSVGFDNVNTFFYKKI